MEKHNAILVIYTGGTIGMEENPETKKLEAVNLERFNHYIPDLKSISLRIDYQSTRKQIDSSDMTPEVWEELGKSIQQNYNKYDGFVVLHGTDTMAYTASALSFMIENLNKPVVFTGSQLPMSNIRTDGRENFITALVIASEARVPEVCIYFENHLFRGNRTSKLNAENFNAFFSGNYPALAEVGVHIRYNKEKIAQGNSEKLSISGRFDTNIVVLKLFPGITRRIMHDVLNLEGLRGVILQTYGNGNAPTAEWFSEELRQAVERYLIIYNVSQCQTGGISHKRYQASLNLDGVVDGYDITFESAITKMMFLLGQYKDNQKVRQQLITPLRGEMSIFSE